MTTQDITNETAAEAFDTAIVDRLGLTSRLLTCQTISAMDLDRNMDSADPVKIMEIPEGASACSGHGKKLTEMAIYKGRRYMLEIIPYVAEASCLKNLIVETLTRADHTLIAFLAYLQDHRKPSDTWKHALTIGRSEAGADKLLSRDICLDTTGGHLLRLGTPLVVKTSTGWQMTTYLGIGVYTTA